MKNKLLRGISIFLALVLAMFYLTGCAQQPPILIQNGGGNYKGNFSVNGTVTANGYATGAIPGITGNCSGTVFYTNGLVTGCV